MKTSETWNQGFEDLGLDPQQGHLVGTNDNLAPGYNEPFIFESQQIPYAQSRLPPHQMPLQYIINFHRPNSSVGKGQQPFEYSQTELGQQFSELRKGQDSHLEDKNMNMLQGSVPNNGLKDQQTKNKETKGQQQQMPPFQQSPSSNVQISSNSQKQRPQQIRIPSHYPPQNFNQIVSEQPGLNNYNSTDILPLGIQQSYAPSQKTLIMGHTQSMSPGSPVYKSNVTTERLQSQPSERPEKRMMTTPNSNELMSPMLRQPEVKSMINHGQIPQGNYKQMNNFGISQAQWWRDKYQQLRHQFEAFRAQKMSQFEAAGNKIYSLQQQNHNLRENYDKVINQYKKRVEQIKFLKQSTSPNAQVQKFQDPQQKRQLEERGMLINLLKKQNQQNKQQLQNFNKLCSQFELQNQDLQQAVSLLKMELQQKESEMNELKRVESTLKHHDISQFSRSRIQSAQNTRVMDLEMQNGRLQSEMASRDQAHEQEMKLNSIKFNQLAERLKSATSEKDQQIKLLQEKVTILESDLNKKDSLLRNLRDELVEAERKKTSPKDSHLHNASLIHSTTGSAIGPLVERSERAEKQQAKRQIENLKKHLFDKERELTIQKQRQQELKQILAQSENTATRRKNENQLFRRQLAQLEDQLAQHQMLRETLEKKNQEIAELRETLIQKQYSGEYESLTKENEKLRQISMKRNTEIMDLNERLLTADKKIRQQESFNPRIQELEEVIEELNHHLRGMQSELQRLTVSLQHSNEKVLQAELQVQREREKQMQLENMLQEQESKIEEVTENYQKAEQKAQLLERQLESLASKMVKIQKENEELKQASETEKNQLQRQLASRTIQLKTVCFRQNELELLRTSSLKQIEDIEIRLSNEVDRKNQELQFVTNKNRQLQVMIKIQKDKLLKIESELQGLRQVQFKHQNCQKTINSMTDKIATYEMKMLKSPYAKQLFQHLHIDYSNQVFQNRLIYQLKAQNQSLKTRLEKSKNQNQNSMVQLPDIKDRLNEFANHLQETIEEQNSLRKVKSQKSILTNPNTELSDPFNNQNNNKNLKSQTLPKLSLQNLEKFYEEKVTYYRKQNAELQQRITTLIKLNQQLKQNLERLSSNKDQQLKQFYNSQLKREKQKSIKLQKQLESCKREAKRVETEVIEINKRKIKTETPQNISYNFILKDKISDWQT